MIKFGCDYLNYVSAEDFEARCRKAGHYLGLAQHSLKGGWVDWPIEVSGEEIESIKAAADLINEHSEYLVCIGVGGSYLGHRAIISALGEPRRHTKIIYAGNSLSAEAMAKLMRRLGEADFSINVISKSGETLEPAVAFRLLRKKLIEKYGAEGAKERIFVTTSADKGRLHDEAVAQGYTRFVIPDNIGGRYSVLTPVGLLPMAVAGVDIEALLNGAIVEREDLFNNLGGDAAKYAAMRNILFEQFYTIEALAFFEPVLNFFGEWWKQLYGESEGKDGRGIFPTTLSYSADLHSLGQYMQEGRRDLFETFLEVKHGEQGFVLTEEDGDADGLNYLAGKELDELNKVAAEATRQAHVSGGVPVVTLTMPAVDEVSLGALVYFFEAACAMSAFSMGVNPFDQPGVEAYKNEMFRRLGRPGYNK